MNFEKQPASTKDLSEGPFEQMVPQKVEFIRQKAEDVLRQVARKQITPETAKKLMLDEINSAISSVWPE